MRLMTLLWMFLLSSMTATSMAATAKLNGTWLMFGESEKDVDPYQTRIIVTPEFIRFDDGRGDVDFILFDRKRDIIYNVNSEERTAMSIAYEEVKATPPFTLKHAVKTMDDMKDAPTVAGRKLKHYQFHTNATHCFDVVVAPGLMEDVVQAMRAFTRVLASNSAVTFNSLPADLHDACEMSRSIFAAERYLEQGFPVHQWDVKGRSKMLLDFKEKYEADPALFILPADYRQFSIKDFRAGRVWFNQ